MAYLATLLIKGSFSRLNFCDFESENGFPSDRRAYVVEELTSTGVDGERLRLPRRDWKQFTAFTISDCLTWAAAQRLAAAMMDCNGQYGTLNILTQGSSFIWKNLSVKGVNPIPTAGKVSGGGAAAGATCHVRCDWLLKCTENAVYTG